MLIGLHMVAGLSQDELVALLRSRARKNGSHTSSYRGVSLLKQTGEWRAQISIGGKQVHLACKLLLFSRPLHVIHKDGAGGPWTLLSN